MILIQIKKMIMFVVNCNVIQLKNSKFSIKISNHHILTLINFKICQSDKQNIKNCIIWMLVLNATAKPSNRSRERMWGPIASETAGEPNHANTGQFSSVYTTVSFSAAWKNIARNNLTFQA